MAKNRSMQQKALINARRRMIQSKSKNMDIMSQEYHYPDYIDRISRRTDGTSNGRNYTNSIWKKCVTDETFQDRNPKQRKYNYGIGAYDEDEIEFVFM